MQCHIPVISAIQEITNRITIQIGLGIKQDPISKITNTKRAGGVAQVIEHLLGMMPLNSALSSKKKKKKV
jgi:hypothetical protein